MTTGARSLVHGTAVAFDGRAVLLRGPSGAGKSDLALRLLGLGAETCTGLGLSPYGPRLVADDQVWLEQQGDGIVASAPETIRGRLEVRGIGIVAVPTVASANLHVVVDLVPVGDVPRMPLEAQTEDLLGVRIALIKLYAFEASAPLKVALTVLARPGSS